MSSRVAVARAGLSPGITDLCHRMQASEEAAFTEFYDCYYDRLFRYLVLLTRGNEPVTRELIQVTMTKAMQKIRVFSSEPQLWNWLAAIARNSFIDSLRRSRGAPNIVPLLPDDSIETVSPSPDHADDELIAGLEHCLQDLGPEERELIEAFYFNNNSHRWMAERQGTTAKAVESRLARVRQKLRVALLNKLRDEND